MWAQRAARAVTLCDLQIVVLVVGSCMLSQPEGVAVRPWESSNTSTTCCRCAPPSAMSFGVMSALRLSAANMRRRHAAPALMKYASAMGLEASRVMVAIDADDQRGNRQIWSQIRRHSANPRS